MNINLQNLKPSGMKLLIILVLTATLSTLNAAYASGGQDDDDHEMTEHEEEQSVKLTPKQLEVAGVVVNELRPSNITDVINAPGEIMLNDYRTTSVTTRISAQVVQRHAKLGDVITKGQPLLTLSSVEMSSAQGDLLISGREWQRVKKLGKKVVSAQRYTEARVEHEQAKARVIAYGMTSDQVDKFLKNDDASKANGSFQLLAPQDGTVIFDHFIVGELIEPGEKLFIISDESVLWVEAKLTPNQALNVTTDNIVSIIADGNVFPGKVVQIHHALDEHTRTLGVRIEVENPDDKLHPGVFVQAQISSNDIVQALAVPIDAVLRGPDGDWVVFTEHEAGEFEPQEVDLVRNIADQSVITGIEVGTRVVTRGAFFIQSELMKSGFGDDDH
jgi:membrane fusion protein, heavy metal efflux system